MGKVARWRNCLPSSPCCLEPSRWVWVQLRTARTLWNKERDRVRSRSKPRILERPQCLSTASRILLTEKTKLDNSRTMTKQNTIKVAAVPKTIRNTAVVIRLTWSVHLRLNFAITGIEIIAMRRLQQPAAIVAIWLFSSENPASWKMITE